MRSICLRNLPPSFKTVGQHRYRRAPILDRMTNYLSEISDATLLDSAGYCLAFVWLVLNTPIVLLYSRAAYLQLSVVAASFLLSLALFCLIPAVRKLLDSRWLPIACGIGAFAIGAAVTTELATAQKFACLCVQYSLCGIVFASCCTRLGRHELKHVLVAGCSAPVFVGILQLFFVLTAYALGILENTTNFTTLSLRLLAVMPALAGLCCGMRQGTARQADTKAEEASVHLDGRHFLESAGNTFTTNTPRKEAPVISGIVLCVGLFVCTFFFGTTFNPHQYDFVWIITVGAAIAALPALAGMLVFMGIEDSLYGKGFAWTLALGLAFVVCSLAIFTLYGEGDRAPFGIAFIYATQILLNATLMMFVCLGSELSCTPLRLWCALAGSGFLFACDLGIRVKQGVGYSVSSLTPFIIAAMAALAVLYLIQNALQTGGPRNSVRQANVELAIGQAPTSFALGHESSGKASLLGNASSVSATTAPTAESSIEDGSFSTAPLLTVGTLTDMSAQLDMMRLDALKQLGLSERECEVAVRALRGCTYAEVADDLGISVKTVGYHLSSAYRKAEVCSKRELAARVDETLQQTFNGENAD